MEFLTEIKRLYEATRLPVHYERVAEKLGVSKWSAYEMLKKLEKEGLVCSQYQVNQAEKYPGRAMVMFAPTALLDKILVRKGSDEKAAFKDWQPVKEKLFRLFKGLKKKNPEKLRDQLMQEISLVDEPLAFNAHFIAILMLQAQTLGEKGMELVRKMVMGAADKEAGLSIFTGTVIGSMLKNTSQIPFISQLTLYLNKFQENWGQFSESDQALLVDFFREALELTT